MGILLIGMNETKVWLTNGGKIPFLDAVVSRETDGTIKTQVYRKPTYTGQYLNYPSYCPLEHKEAEGMALFRRATSYPSDLATQCREEQRIVQELRNNMYTMTRTTMMKRRKHRRERNRERRRIITGELASHIEGLSQDIRRELKEFGIPISFRAHKTIGKGR